MLRILIFLLTAILIISHSSRNAHAIADALSVPNNRIGIHILFDSELAEASRLVNSNGGDWGYVTIPIQAADKDLEKWQKFMDDARNLHLIPIIRIATENYYFDTRVWRKPSESDVLDFANFFDSLNWPTKNRYVVIFNEVNRSDEWGDEVNPAEYAKILEYAVSIFKSKNEDFYIISAGLDNASANLPKESMNEYDFMLEMNNAVPGIFNQIDAIASHSYPNPGFEQPPWVISRKSISSFIYEKRLAELLADKKLPVFITETGWSSDRISRPKIASYFTEAFDSVWATDDIVAVTPFLFNAGAGPFAQFSLINNNGEKSEIYNAINDIQKIKGNPTQSETNTMYERNLKDMNLPTKDFTNYKELDNSSVKNRVSAAVELIRWILRI